MRAFTCSHCGGKFTPDNETPRFSAQGEEKTHWFCSEQCNDDWWAHNN